MDSEPWIPLGLAPNRLISPAQLKELKERQKQQLRHKALKKGLDPEALTGKYPPMIQVASKYERRVDTRSYDDKKKLFEGVSIRGVGVV